ncbi:centrosomal protein of 170 kDa-like isoform X2 [Anguilla anguilla]|uniref:centrosomal protein of 170 kDa-like isoform X2 n=1 Tax=Anguilla anguilla TaxID=7936 RepID=UPI0015B2D427|nr:centrosomal protein of 170 kDa-like isoform X2 [Anguilla anguilla]
MSLTSWFLVSSGGTRHRLPREMIFVGRDDCELMLQSRSVDKQHAVINYEAASDQHKVKDLGSLNGTFVNDVRIQEQMYFTLKMDDKLRFGYDTNLFTVVRGELQVPEEALKHEKFTSQLQLSKKQSKVDSPKPAKPPVATPPESKAVEGASEGPSKPADTHKGEDKMAGDLSTVHRGTPLYGQPSWWGDEDADDENSFKQETKSSSKKQENSGAGSMEAQRCENSKDDGLYSLGSEPSYFEIPAKEVQKAESSIHEVPTKDTEGVAVAPATAVALAASAPGHASFTIEFDNTSPGKVTIKDHVAKFTPDPRPRPRKSSLQGGAGLSTLQAAIMASESKVADWLAQNEPPLARRDAAKQGGESVQSDVGVQLRRLKGSKHVDGTQSDSENGAGLRLGRKPALEERLQAGPGRAGQGVARGREGAGPVSRKAFMIEFFDEANPRKRRSYSFSQTAPLLGEGPSPTPPSRRAPGDCAMGGVSADVASALAAVAPTASRLLLKQRSEDPSGSGRAPTSVGQQAAPADLPKSAPRPPVEKEHEDDHSDKGTYTIELEKPSHEEEEARRMIDKVFGVEGNRDSARTGRPEHLQEGAEAKPPGCSATEILPEDLVALGSSSWVSQWASLAANHTRTDPEGSGGEATALVLEKDADVSGSGQSAVCSSGHTERRRRALPQLPGEERPQLGRGPCSIGEKQDTEPQEKDRPPRPGHRGGAGAVATAGTQAKQTPALPSRPPAWEKRGEEEEKKPLVRQGSFTVEKPSAHVPQELIPRIAQGPAPPARQRSDSGGSLDTVALLRDTEAVMAFLEARLRDEGEPTPPGPADRPPPAADAASSQAARDAERKSAPKRRTLSSLHKEKSAATPSSTAREHLERRARPRPSESREPRNPAHPGPRSRRPSLDLTDDDPASSLPHSAFSSDQETGSARSHGRGPLTSSSARVPLSKPESGSALRPRPTRTSLLRRARLGEASDTDLADADRASVASEVSTTSSTSRQPAGRKAPSRIDLLAQPRRTRPGSLSARSDSEATLARGSASTRLSAETALRLGLRSGSAADAKPPARLRANSVTKLPDAKAKPTSSAHSASAAPGRWRRLPPEYASTSEDEFGSNRNAPKPGRLRPGSTLRGARLGGSTPALPGSPGGVALRHHRMRDQEEYIRDWTSHSEEIARLFPCVRRISQDLAKDLAILAREIHDVAGEIDSVGSSGTAPSTTVSTAATTPGSAIDTREELVDRVFDESLNFRKIPPIVLTKAPEINGRPAELRLHPPDAREAQTALRRRTWNREEAVLDSLLLTSVSQLSVKIRQSMDKTAGKIRILFKDKDRNWDEIESKLQSESDMPLLKTSNKEISSILLELKRVEKQLQVINVMVDPDGTLEALTSPTLPKHSTSTGPQGPLSRNGTAQAPLTSTPAGETERDPCLRLGRLHPSGEESSASCK